MGLHRMIIPTLNMTVTKASFDPNTKVMRIRMVASDTGPDVYGERMSIELFQDFCSRIANGTPVPVKFRSVLQEKSGWAGGDPYVSISHYKSGIEGKNIPADVEKVYVDGQMLKATAICRDTPLGRALFQALKDDLAGVSKFQDKIRVSIGFLDLKHSHGNFIFERDGLEKSCPMCENNSANINKTYLAGPLVHLAMTRKPANLRTKADPEVMRMADEIMTRKDDAESIVGDALAESLEVNKSTLEQAEELLTVKAVSAPMDDEEECTGKDGCTCKACASKKKEPMKSEVVEPAVTKSAFELVVDKLRNTMDVSKSMGVDAGLANVQPIFEELAIVIKDEFEKSQPPQVVAKIDPAMAQFMSELKGLVTTLSTSVSSLTTDVAILKSQNGRPVVTPTESSVPAPRNLVVSRSTTNGMPNFDVAAQKPMSLREIAERSVQPR